MSKNKIIIGVVALVLIVGGFTLFGGNDGAPNGESENNGRPGDNIRDAKPGETSVEGKLGCLPLKSGQTPDADDCVIGLVGNDGKYYALNTSNVEVIEKGISIDTTVRLTGKLHEADASSEEAGIFRYDGVLDVRVMQNQSD